MNRCIAAAVYCFFPHISCHFEKTQEVFFLQTTPPCVLHHCEAQDVYSSSQQDHQGLCARCLKERLRRQQTPSCRLSSGAANERDLQSAFSPSVNKAVAPPPNSVPTNQRASPHSSIYFTKLTLASANRLGRGAWPTLVRLRWTLPINFCSKMSVVRS